MNDVERMYRHLVHTIRASFPQYLSQPFEVGELYQTVLPYRLHRRELGLETNQDYELALMELLSGSGGYLVVDDKMRDVLKAERGAANPDTARIRDFAHAHVALAPEALYPLEAGTASRSSGSGDTMPRTASTRTPVAQAPVPAPPSEPRASAAATDAMRRPSQPFTVVAAGDTCGYCKGSLPAGRQISFCPHCGQDLTLVHCPACGSELERGWKFCVICGRAATDT